MPDNPALRELENLGLTHYEARIFVALTVSGESTVGELHRAARVPRPAIYEVVERLMQRHIVEESPGRPRRFKALPPRDAMSVLERSFSESGRRVRQFLDAAADKGKGRRRGNMVWLTQGDANIQRRIQALIKGARSNVIAAGTARRLASYLPEWEAASKSVRLEFLTSAGGSRRDIASLQRLGRMTVIRFPLPRGGTGNMPMMLVVDRSTALFYFPLYGDGSVDSAALWSSAAPFVAINSFLLRSAVRSVGKVR